MRTCVVCEAEAVVTCDECGDHLCLTHAREHRPDWSSLTDKKGSAT